MNSAPPRHNGFTLRECAALTCIAALSAAAIVPCLAAAQTNAQSSVGYANLKLLMLGQSAFAASHDQLLPGPHSSGWEATLSNGQSIVGDTTPSTPTQNVDWISPSVGDELGFSPNRAERAWQILEFLADPRAIRHDDQLYSGGAATDVGDFVAIEAARGLLQVSYVAPAPFYLLSPYSSWAPTADGEFDVMHTPPYPAVAPDDFIPRLDRVGSPAHKVGVADGTRYLSLGGIIGGGGTILDYDVSPMTTFYGNFLTSTPIYDESVAYGRATLPIQYDAENVRLSMRYPTLDSAFGRAMHTARFDGSVVLITAEEAWGQASLWYPTGSTFKTIHATPESKAIYTTGQIIP